MSLINIYRGLIWTAAQWQSAFDGKQDVLANPAANNFLVGNGSAWQSQSLQSVRAIFRSYAYSSPQVLVDFNSGNSDWPVTIVLPTGFTRYRVAAGYISGADHTLTTATVGLFTAAGGTGTAIVTGGTAITLSSSSENTNNNTMALPINNSTTQSYTIMTLYLRVGTAEGAAATGIVTLTIAPLT